MYHRFEETPFINELGQTIKVGDQVVAVSTGYSHRINITKGMYLGRRGNKPQVLVVETTYQWVDAEGNKSRWAKPGSKREVLHSTTRKTNLPCGRIFLMP